MCLQLGSTLNMPPYLVRLAAVLLTFTIGVGAAALWVRWSNRPATPTASQASVPIAQPKAFSDTHHEEVSSGDLESIYVADETLTYNNYEVATLHRKIKSPVDRDTDIAYAVLRKNGKKVAQFDYSGAVFSTEVRFGLFPVLRGAGKQLIIEITTYRGWRYWVVDLSTNFRILYDSGDYDVGYSLRALDLNHDGQYELIHTLQTFRFLYNLDNTNSPFIDIVFKYELKAGKFIPANPEFREFALKDIAGGIKEVRKFKESLSEPAYPKDLLAAVLEVTIRYLYTGQQKEAWAFYDEEYDLPDKQTIKSDIRKRLREDRVYSQLRQQ